MKFKRLVAAALLVYAAGHAAAKPLLGSAPAQAPLPVAVQTIPHSAFHGWPEVHQRAAAVVDQWRNEPVTLPWTRIQLDLYVKHKMMPTRGARGLALMHVAMHDALELAQTHGLDSKLAVSMAASQVLGYLFTAEERAFDRLSFAIAAKVTGQSMDNLSPAALQAIRLGYDVGQAAIRRGESDGAQRGWNGLRLQYYGEGRYYGPGAWEPTPPYFYYPPDEPFAPLWKPWMLASSDEFRPTPPAYGSERYVADLREVLEVTRALTPQQLEIAKFWVDGHGSVTPPGHWNQIAIDEAKKAGLGANATAQLFAKLNIALADAFLAAWECKYYYWTARPITVSGPLLGTPLQPALLTPPFPSYVSGHAAFSGAAARVLGQAFPARAAALETMAEEAAMSRLYAGIHFRHDNEDGLALGRRVAEKVLASQAWTPY
jgi:membrane-associated phospholipid phosphatase